ncbi:MAG: hypothetical protein Alpg2KO_26070 [Alphaproteobacteria bacterium]
MSYGLIVGLVSVVVLASVSTIGSEGVSLFETVDASIAEANGQTGQQAASSPSATPFDCDLAYTSGSAGLVSTSHTFAFSSVTTVDEDTCNFTSPRVPTSGTGNTLHFTSNNLTQWCLEMTGGALEGASNQSFGGAHQQGANFVGSWTNLGLVNDRVSFIVCAVP